MGKNSSADTAELSVGGKKKGASPSRKQETKRRIILTIIHGNEIDFGKTYNLSQDVILIGRDKSNTVPLDDAGVSKTHCEIRRVKSKDGDEQVIIKDLNSTNGTFVNGWLIRQQKLNPADKIAVGETVFRFSYNDEIEEEYHSKLFNFATTDSLTGLYNRRYILNELENQYKIAKRNFRTFSIVVLDIDNFKGINDTYGHPAGDEYLKNTAFIINRTLREQDITGRLGGDEFLIILPETDLDGAFNLANRIRERIEGSDIIFGGQQIKSTVSAGVSQYRADITRTGADRDTAALFQIADRALYEAKDSGKNRVVKA